MLLAQNGSESYNDTDHCADGNLLADEWYLKKIFLYSLKAKHLALLVLLCKEACSATPQEALSGRSEFKPLSRSRVKQ